MLSEASCPANDRVSLRTSWRCDPFQPRGVGLGEHQEVGDLVVHVFDRRDDPRYPVSVPLLLEVLQEQGGEKLDAAQGIPDLVGDVGGHLAHGGEFFAPLGHLFENLDPGNVPAG